MRRVGSINIWARATSASLLAAVSLNVGSKGEEVDCLCSVSSGLLRLSVGYLGRQMTDRPPGPQLGAPGPPPTGDRGARRPPSAGTAHNYSMIMTQTFIGVE